MEKSWLEAILKRHERESQIFKIVNFEVENAVPKGVNYASVIRRAKFDVIFKNGRKARKSLIIKVEHKGPKAEALKDYHVFQVETKVYRDILNRMELLMEEYEDKREILWGQMLGFKPFHTLLFEDLATNGFKVAERRNGLGLKEGKLTLKSLGRFHAMSKILFENGIISRNDVPPFSFILDCDVSRNMLKNSMRQLGDVMSTKWPPKWKEVSERIAQQEDVIFDRVSQLYWHGESNKSVFTVLNHGDLWTCNFMFKYEENEPTSIRFLDFQTCHVGSYMWDVLYFVYTSIQPELRRKHLHDLYSTYLDSLAFNLKFFGFGREVPTLNEMLREAERLEYFTLICLGLCFPAMTAETDEAFDIENLNNPSGDLLNPDVLCSDMFIQTCGEDFKRLVQNEVI